jgi:ATP-dependent helicase HrpA
MVFLRGQYEAIRDRVSGAVMNTMFDTVSLVARILQAARGADKALKDATGMAVIAQVADARAQLEALIGPGFAGQTGLARLQHLPRYISGVRSRAEKLADNPHRDRAWMNEFQTALDRYTAAGGTIPIDPHGPPALVHARWMLEEYRVSLFATQLGTSESVSLQRITKVLAG